MPAPAKVSGSRFAELTVYAAAFFGFSVWFGGAPTYVAVSVAGLVLIMGRVIYILP